MASASCYAALAPLLELLHDILHRDRYPKFLLGRQQILNSLHKKFTFFLEFLEGYTAHEDVVDSVETRIRDAAYRVQDIIQTQITNQILDSESASGEIHVIVRMFRQLISLCQNTSSLQLILIEYDEQVDSIVKEVMTIKESPSSEALHLSDYSTGVDAFQPAPNGTSNIVVGLDQDIILMKALLCGESPELRVISIVGMGGIGKTTLAKSIFDDALIRYHFDCHIWITITQEYRMNEVLGSILRSLGMMTHEFLGERESSLMEQVYKCLVGRRYLIVLDDVWSETLWDGVRPILPDSCNGSRILVTTRSLDLASYVGHTTHEMRLLSDYESWELLKVKVFGPENCPLELEDIGRFIARRCQGHPLSIIVTSNTLFNNRTRRHWEMVAKHVSSVLSSDYGGTLFSIISQSYNSLRPQSKACLLYIGCFPEDSDINISKLTKLWIAEGFLYPSDGSKTLEQVAEDCVLDLVNRSLVLVTQRRANGNIKCCTMHDIVRDFCLRIAHREKFFHAMSGRGDLDPEEVENVRRISFYQTPPFGSHPHNFGKLVRSILCFGNTFRGEFNTLTWDSLELLMVLGTYVSWPIPDAIFQMFHLKYLELYVIEDLRSGALPPSISALQNLQTLYINLSPDSDPISLPPQIWDMTQLRHLIIGAMILPPVPMISTPVQKLESLQTLMTVENFKFTKESIEAIPNLAKLRISYRGSEGSDIWELCCLNNLVQLCRLDELTINFYTPSFSCVDSLWSNIVFPLNVRKLSLGGCRFSWDEMTVVGSLPNLQVLRLRMYSFVGEEWEPTKGEFKCLKFLLLENLDIKYWQAEHTHFPRLEHLKIRHCYELAIPLKIGDISTLRVIDVYDSHGAIDSALQIQEQQRDYGKDKLEVHVRY